MRGGRRRERGGQGREGREWGYLRVAVVHPGGVPNSQKQLQGQHKHSLVFSRSATPINMCSYPEGYLPLECSG